MTVPVRSTVSAASCDDVEARQQVPSQIRVLINAGIRYRNNYSVSLANPLRLGHMQKLQMPLVAADSLRASCWK